MSERCFKAINNHLWRIAPGVMVILNYTSKKIYNYSFAELLVRKPSSAYTVVKKSVRDDAGSRIIMKSLLAELVDTGEYTSEEIYRKIESGEDVDISNCISACIEHVHSQLTLPK